MLVDELGEVAIEGLARLSAGASRETWAFDALVRPDGGEQRHELILQRDRSGAAGESCAREAVLLGHARAGGVPVPQVVAAGRTPNPLGRSYSVTRRLPGETIARKILRDDAHAAFRARFVDEAARALAAIHALDPAPLEGVLGLTDRPVEMLAELHDSLTDRHPVFALALRWLGRHQPPLGAARVVHGDFRLGNLLVDDGRLAAVLDWELAHLGDPIEDLGWLCVRAWRFGASPPVAGMAGRDELLAAYRVASSNSVDAGALRWWETYGTLKWGLTTLIMGSQFQPGVPGLLEQAVIARRVAETEHDLLLLLAPADVAAQAQLGATGVAPAAKTQPAVAPHDPPGAAELLEAVRGFLAEELAEKLQGRDRFLARVAANAVSIAERELRLGPSHSIAHRDRLRRLGFGDDRELGAAIRSGSLDERGDELISALWETTLEKLAVTNPGYTEESG